MYIIIFEIKDVYRPKILTKFICRPINLFGNMLTVYDLTPFM